MVPLAKIIIGHTQPMFCFGFNQYIKRSKGIADITEAYTAEHLAYEMANNLFHILVIEDEITGMNTSDFIRQTKLNYGQLKIIVLVTKSEPLHLSNLLASGAEGFIHKNAVCNEMKRGILAVIDEKSFMCSDIAKIIAKNNLPEKNITEEIEIKLDLCPQEKIVYKMRARQKSIKEIMEALKLKKSTVKQYSSSVLQKVKRAGYKNAFECAFKTGYLLQAFYFSVLNTDWLSELFVY